MTDGSDTPSMNNWRSGLSPRVVGLVATLVALVSPERLLAPIGLLLGGNVVGPALAVLIDGMIAFVGLLGGVILLAGRRRGRFLVAGASGIGIVAAFVTLVFAQAGVPRYGPSAGLWVVIHAVVAGAALLIPAAATDKGRWQDVAYASYLFLGFTSLWAGYVLFPGPAGSDTSGAAGMFGFLVLVPYGLAGVVALLFGAYFSLVSCREAQLLFLLAATMVFGLYLNFWWHFEWLPWILYGLTCTVLGVTFFAFRRRVHV